MSSLKLTYGDIYTQVSEFLRIGSTPTGSDLTLVQNIVKRAYRKFLYPVHPESGLFHTWSFLRKREILTTKSDIYRYELPTDFVSMLTSFKMVGGENKRNPEYVDIATINGLRTTDISRNLPKYFCIDIGNYHKEFGQLHEVKFWNTPDTEYTYEYSYIFEPSMPDTDTDVLVGGARASEVLLQMALAEAESQEDEDAGVQTSKANNMLAAYMIWDKAFSLNTYGVGWDDSRKVTRPIEQKGGKNES
jgi:hypothetical protein